jgi:hypothetical protein
MLLFAGNGEWCNLRVRGNVQYIRLDLIPTRNTLPSRSRVEGGKMKFTSSIRKQNQEGETVIFSPGSWSAISKIFGGFALATVLALAPLPTFAQHGGGGGGAHGGGGGAHAGGGGSSAGHSSGGGHAASAPSGAGASAGAGNTSSSGGRWWNPFHGSGSNPTSSATGAKGTTTGTATGSTTDRFAANNNTWEAPPAARANGTAVKHSGAAGVSAPRGAIASPPHVPVPRRGRGIGYGGYYPGYPFYPGYGFGFGFGGFGYGFYGPCDPFWGCYGYGSGFYGGGAGYGFYGGSFSGYSGSDLSYSAADDSAPSQEPNPSLYAQAPETTDVSGGVTAGPAGKHVVAVLYLKDGSSYAVTDYWLEGGKLHYVASYGGENAIDESTLDLQRTVNENAAQGLTFTLRPAPDVAPETPKQ